MVASVDAAKSSKSLKLALDAAIVRVIESGSYLALESQWGINTVASFSCTPEPDWYAFPSADEADGVLKDVLASRILKLATLGPYDWGPDGDYTQSPPVGFWPGYELAILEQLQLAYGDDLSVERVYFSDSQPLLDSLQAGHTHASGPYYVLGGATNATYRQAVLRTSCTTLGYDSTMFTRNTSDIDSLQALQAALRDNPMRPLGALSVGDAHAMRPVLPSGTSFETFQHEDDLVAAVASGEVLAGVLSGDPSSPDGLFTFSSTVVSPRVMFLKGEEEEGGLPDCKKGSSAATRVAELLPLRLLAGAVVLPVVLAVAAVSRSAAEQQ